jgi:hypothetical protein
MEPDDNEKTLTIFGLYSIQIIIWEGFVTDFLDFFFIF